MSRLKGCDKREVERRERDEDTSFSLARSVQDLELAKLRVRQAIKRTGLNDLLLPAIELIEETQKRIQRVRA